MFAELLSVLIYMFDLPREIDVSYIWSGEGNDTVVSDQVKYEVVQDPGDVRYIFQDTSFWKI